MEALSNESPLTTAVVVPQVVEIDMRDSSDYRTMRLKLQMASSGKRQQFSKESEWRELSACDQTETLHHGESFETALVLPRGCL